MEIPVLDNPLYKVASLLNNSNYNKMILKIIKSIIHAPKNGLTVHSLGEG